MNTSSSHLDGIRPSRRGSALVMTLIILVLISIIVLGFATIVRNESPASAAHEERARAVLFSEMGVDMATGILRKETADPNNLSRAWISRPGALIVESGTNRQLDTQIDLHSGVPSNYNPSTPVTWSSPAELNIPSFGLQGSRLLTDRTIAGGGPVALPLRWIYVRRDGSFDSAELPDTSDAQNPLVGRFAFWTDDESTKLNLNTAWKRNPSGTVVANPFPQSHPSNLSLSAIPGFTETMADQLHALITPSHDYTDAPSLIRFLNSVNEARSLDRLHSTTAFSSVLKAARFDLTTYNHSPDTTFFNEPRIVLTTQEKYAPKDAGGNLLTDVGGAPYFFDILKDSRKNQDPGILSNIDPAKLNVTIKKLMSYLSRTDWPMVDGESSFQAKYYNNDTDSLAQLALNIIEYVRSAESSEVLIEPIRGVMSGSNFSLNGGGGSNRSFKGITRSLFLTEIGIFASQTPEIIGPNIGRYRYRFFFEVHLPKHFGLPSVDLAGFDGKRFAIWFTTLSVQGAGAYFDEEGNALSSSVAVVNPANIEGGTGVNGTILAAGGYAKIGFTVYRNVLRVDEDIRSALELHSNIAPNTKYAVTSLPRLDIAPVGVGLRCPTNVAVSDEDAITTWQVDDPCVNSNYKDWTSKGMVLNTLGSAPVSPVNSLGQSPFSTPKQDTDAFGKITNIGIRMPAPKGSAGNLKGIVYSSGELGYVHTGLQPNNSLPSGGVPWRTLHLQPEGNPTVVPDWAFMDLFTVPVEAPPNAKGVFSPGLFSKGGQINVNSRIEPYGNDVSLRPKNTDALERNVGLKAALLDIKLNDAGDRMSASDAEALANNIYTHKISPKGARYGSPALDVYDSPGEVAEVAGIADGGEASEEVTRGLANLMVTRGNVFSVFSIGQALKQTPAGSIIVTGEQRINVQVERCSKSSTSVQVRKLAERSLTP